MRKSVMLRPLSRNHLIHGLTEGIDADHGISRQADLPIESTERDIARGIQRIAGCSLRIVQQNQSQTALLQFQPGRALPKHAGDARGTYQDLFAGHHIGA